jgi:hypothetical protein
VKSFRTRESLATILAAGLIATALSGSAAPAQGLSGATEEVLTITLGASSEWIPEPVISPLGNVAVFFDGAVADIAYPRSIVRGEAVVSAVIVDLTDVRRQATVKLDPLPVSSATARFSLDETEVFIGSSDVVNFRTFLVFDMESLSVSGEVTTLTSSTGPLAIDPALALSPSGPWYSEILFNPRARAVVISSLPTGEIRVASQNTRPPSPWFSPTNDRVVLPLVGNGRKEILIASLVDEDEYSLVDVTNEINGYPAEILAESQSGSLFAVQARAMTEMPNGQLAPVTEVVFVDTTTNSVRGRVPDSLVDEINIIGFSADEQFAIHRPLGDTFDGNALRQLQIIDVDRGTVENWDTAPDIAYSVTGQAAFFSLSESGESVIVGLDAIHFVDWGDRRVTRVILLETPTLPDGGSAAQGKPVLLAESGELLLSWSVLDSGGDRGDSAGASVTYIIQRVQLDVASNQTQFFIPGNRIGFDGEGRRAFVLREPDRALEVWNLENRALEAIFSLETVLDADNLTSGETLSKFRLLPTFRGPVLDVSADGSRIHLVSEEISIEEDGRQTSQAFYLYAVDTDSGEQQLVHSYPGSPIQWGISRDESRYFASVSHEDSFVRSEFVIIDLSTGETLATQPLRPVDNRSEKGFHVEQDGYNGVLSTTGGITVRDWITGDIRYTLNPPPNILAPLIISPDASRLATLSGSPTAVANSETRVHLLSFLGPESTEGEPVFREFTTLSEGLVTAVFSSSGEALFTLSRDNLTEYEINTGTPIRQANITSTLPSSFTPLTLIASPDGETLWVEYSRGSFERQSVFVPLALNDLAWNVAKEGDEAAGVVSPSASDMSAVWIWVGIGVLVLLAASTLVIWATRRRERQ